TLVRVLLVVHGFPPSATGGTELYAEALALALHDAGDDVHVLTREVDPARPEYALAREERAGIAVTSINHTFRYARGFVDTYRNAVIRRLAGELVDELQPDVVHLHHLTGLSADLPAELARRRLPTVL